MGCLIRSTGSRSSRLKKHSCPTNKRYRRHDKRLICFGQSRDSVVRQGIEWPPQLHREERRCQNPRDFVIVTVSLGYLAWSRRTMMFRASSIDSSQDRRLKQLLTAISHGLFGADGPSADLDFASIEPLAHDAGRKLARQMCEEAASRQACSEQPHPCPDCGRPSRTWRSGEQQGRMDYPRHRREGLPITSSPVEWLGEATQPTREREREVLERR